MAVVMVMTILNGIRQPHISEPLSHSFSGGIVSVIVIVIVIVFSQVGLLGPKDSFGELALIHERWHQDYHSPLTS